jgi:hypothetical protein
MTRMVRGQLSGLHRRILGALITIDVHARDIVDDLVRDYGSSAFELPAEQCKILVEHMSYGGNFLLTFNSAAPS